MSRWLRKGLGPGLAAVVLLAGCKMGPDTPQLWADVREWYPSQHILVPIEIGGDSGNYAEYRYDYNSGEGWVTEEERTLRITGSDRALIEFMAVDPSWNHRLTVSALSQAAPGQPLEPYSTVERYFGIDTTAPSADPGVLKLTTYQGGTEVSGPLFDEFMDLQFTLQHSEYDDPSGSPIEIYFTRVDPFNTWDPAIPNEDSNRYRRDDWIWVWGGGGGPLDETFRMVVIDAAGNRSAIRQVRFTAP